MLILTHLLLPPPRRSPGVVNSKAGDLILFNVSLFHGCCNAAEPEYTTGLLRAICIMAMCPRRMVAPETLYARRRAYELGEFMGGPLGCSTQGARGGPRLHFRRTVARISSAEVVYRSAVVGRKSR